MPADTRTSESALTPSTPTSEPATKSRSGFAGRPERFWWHRFGHVHQRLEQGFDVSIFEAFTRVHWWPIVALASGPLLGTLAFALVSPLDPAVMATPAKFMLAIFVWVATYWTLGSIPPFATGLLAVALMVFFLGVPAAEGFVGADEGGGITGYQQFLAPAAAPVIVLMFGGFVLSKALHKHGVDKVLAVAFIKPFARDPRLLVLGVMLVSAVFSMWMSNTATAAMMITLIGPVLAQVDRASPLRKALVMAVPIGANVGGIGTPIGTPPNAIAFGALRGAGVDITFVGWLAFGLPVVAVLLAVGWSYLMLVYRGGETKLEIEWPDPSTAPACVRSAGKVIGGLRPLNVGGATARRVCLGTFAMTVLLWVSGSWTGLPIAAVALVPVVVFTATRLLDKDDINSLDWAILLLMAGGLALGAGMQASGLAEWIVSSVPLAGMSPMALLAVIGLLTLTLSTFMSNTAVANMLMAIGLGLAGTGVAASADGVEGVTALQLGVAVALSASLAMGLPVSTPPNAIAFSSGMITIPDFLRVGAAYAVLGVGSVVVVCALFLGAG